MSALLALIVLAATPVERFALVVGYNGAAGDNVQVLHFADDDALAMQRLLGDAGVHVTTLARLDEDSARAIASPRLDGAPTLGAFRTQSAAMLQKMREASMRGAAVELYLFYSGHGDVANGEGYLLLEDGHLTRSMLFDEVLEQSVARVNHVMVDACKSSYIAFDKGVGGSRRNFNGGWQGGDRASVLARTGFLMSTSSGRDSHEWERFQSGVFSHEVRSALRGAADANADGMVDYAEIGGFLASANRAITSMRYRPDFLVRAPGVPPGDLASTVLVWPKGPVVWLDGATLGEHVYVETPRGERVLDAHPAVNQLLPLRLPAERPLYVRDAKETRERVLTEPSARVASLDVASSQVASKGSLSTALANLFVADFDRLDVDNFAAQYDVAALGLIPEPPTPFREKARTAALVTGVAGAAVGTGLLIWAHALSGQSGGSQAERVDTNRSIDRLNGGGIAALAIAGAAAAVWTVLTVTEPTEE